MVDTAASLVWLDASGRTRQTIVKTLAGAVALEGFLQAASLATLNTTWESVMTINPTAASAGTYQNTGDSARLAFQTAAGNIVRLTLPAPTIAIFLADRITVDPANTLVIAIVAAAIGSLTDGSGNAVVSFLGGYYDRSRGSDLLTP